MATTVNTQRSQVQWASGLNLLVGVWLLISAFTVYGRGPMQTNNAICGIAIAVMAAIRAFGAYDVSWLSWANALLGAWVVISPWGVMGAGGPGQMGPTQAMIVNNCIAGVAVIALSIWSAMATNDEGVSTARTTYGT